MCYLLDKKLFLFNLQISPTLFFSFAWGVSSRFLFYRVLGMVGFTHGGFLIKDEVLITHRCAWSWLRFPLSRSLVFVIFDPPLPVPVVLVPASSVVLSVIISISIAAFASALLRLSLSCHP